jgi:hypothetical protein
LGIIKHRSEENHPAFNYVRGHSPSEFFKRLFERIKQLLYIIIICSLIKIHLGSIIFNVTDIGPLMVTIKTFRRIFAIYMWGMSLAEPVF